MEPGNSGVGQYGPTVQSTPANYLRLHAGKKTPYLDFFMGFNSKGKPLHNSTQLDLGKRYYQKTKILSYVLVEELNEKNDSMIWASLDAIKESVDKDNFLNTDLKSMIGIFNWDDFLFERTIKSNSCRIPSKTFISKLTGEMVPINNLTDFKLEKNGVSNIDPKGASVKLYSVKASTREKSMWHQPLIISGAIGNIVLFIKRVNGDYRFLLQFGEELGISGGVSIQPSINEYGEEVSTTDLPPNSKTITEIIQSEEGGRFYKSENRYRIVEVNEGFEMTENHIWVNIQEFKAILGTSNQCSIQLRCISSMVIGILNKKSLFNVK